LLKKFDCSAGFIELYLLARENSLRPYLMRSDDPNDLDLELLAEVLKIAVNILRCSLKGTTDSGLSIAISVSSSRFSRRSADKLHARCLAR
jgi:hypothetical protein